MAFGIGLPDIVDEHLNRIPGVGSFIDTKEEKRRRAKRGQNKRPDRRPPPKPPKAEKPYKPRPLSEWNQPVKPPKRPPPIPLDPITGKPDLHAYVTQADITRRLLPPPRPHGLGGLLNDITAGRGILGIATMGPISLFARPQARHALFNLHPVGAVEKAVAINPYGPEYQPKAFPKGHAASAGMARFGTFIHNALADANMQPAGAVDMARLVSSALIADTVAQSRGERHFANPYPETTKVLKKLGIGTAESLYALRHTSEFELRPVSSILNSLLILGPVARAGSVGALTRSILRANPGLTFKAATAAAIRESYRPGYIAGRPPSKGPPLLGGIDRRGKPTPEYPEGVPLASARHPLTRSLGKTYDWSTDRLPDSFFLSLAGRSRRAQAKGIELRRARVQRDANYAARKHATYVNHGLIKEAKGVLGNSIRRGRDAAVYLGLQAAKDEPPIEGVRYGLQDTQAILERGTRVAHDGDLSDIQEGNLRPGQEAFFRGEKVTVTNVGEKDGTRFLTAKDEAGNVVEGFDHQFRMVGPDEERVQIPLSEHEIDNLNQREADLRAALDELERDKRARKRFEDAVGYQESFAVSNERLGHLIASSHVKPEHWRDFVEGGRLRKNLMTRRWRKQGIRAVPPLSAPLLNHPSRLEFSQVMHEAFPEEQAKTYLDMADSMAEAAVASGSLADAAAWWDRLAETTRGKAEEFAARNPEALLQSGIGERHGLVRSYAEPVPRGEEIPETRTYRDIDGRFWTGVHDNGDGTVTAYHSHQGWVTFHKEAIDPRVAPSDAFHIGDRIVWHRAGTEQYGTVEGYTGMVQDSYGNFNSPQLTVRMDRNPSVLTDVPLEYAVQVPPPEPSAAIYYSRVQDTIAGEKWPNKMPPDQIEKKLTNTEGIKAEDVYWMGMTEEALRAKFPGQKSITKEQLLDHMSNSLNGINLDEAVFSSLAGNDRWGPSGGYSNGGLLIRTPTDDEPYYELLMKLPVRADDSENMVAGHWSGHENVVFHIRFHVLDAEDGVRTLLIDELQSDWHRKALEYITEWGTTGYRMPPSPAVRAELAALDKQIRPIQELLDNTRGEFYNNRDLVVNTTDRLVDNALSQFYDDPNQYQLQTRSRWDMGDQIRAQTNWNDPEVLAAGERITPGFRDAQVYVERMNKIQNILRRLERRHSQLRDRQSNTVPDVAWKDNEWIGLALKRMVRWAADDGEIKRLLWTTGHDHYVRYNKYTNLPLSPRTERRYQPIPDEFYYRVGSIEDSRGEIAPTGYMQQPIPGIKGAVERRMSEVPPERAKVEFNDIAAQYGSTDSNIGDYFIYDPRVGRHARIKETLDNGDAWDVEYLPASADPQKVEISYRGQASGDYHNYNLTVYNRLGEKLVDTQIDGDNDPYYYGRTLFEHAQEGLDPNSDGYVALDVLHDLEWGKDTMADLERDLNTELDQAAYDEWLGEADTGDFERIKNHTEADIDRTKSHLHFYDTTMRRQAEKHFKKWGIKVKHGEGISGANYPNIYKGRFSYQSYGPVSEEGLMDAWGFELPDELLKSATDDIFSLFQTPITGEGLPHGALELIQGTWLNPEKFAVRLFESANASTVPHELAHIGLYDLHPRDLKTIEDDLQGGVKLAAWQRTHHERFTRAFDQFLQTGLAATPKLTGVLGRLAHIVQVTYGAIRRIFPEIHVSPAVAEVFDRMVVPSSVDEARAYVPHRSKFETQLTDYQGGVRLPAGGQTIGVTRRDPQAFPRGENAQVLWESGELNTSPRVITSQYLNRQKFRESQAIREQFYGEAHPIGPGQKPPPKSAWLIRDPNEVPETIRHVTRAATRLNEDDFARLSGDMGVNDLSDLRKQFFAKPGEDVPWAGDYQHVRWIEPWKVRTLIANVFPSSPRGRAASTLGIANTVSRMSQIYLRPIRYMTGNIPANVVLMALTHPTALPKSMRPFAAAIRNAAGDFGKGPAKLAESHPSLYDAIKVESGDVQAQAGLPDFYTVANNAFQSNERRLNRWSSELADRLGELVDQPFRAAVWEHWAKRYGYDTPDDWQHLISSDNPAVQRIRDEIAQRTRNDMIDFNAITPTERQHIARFFYLWAFTRGYIKWPLTFVREYPERAAALSLASQQGQKAQLDRPYPGEWNDPRLAAMIPSGAGTSWDVSSWAPGTGTVEAANTLWSLIHGDLRPLANYLTPGVESGGSAIFNPYQKTGWGALGQQAIANWVPPFAQAGLNALGVPTPQGRKADQGNKITDALGKVPGIGGALEASDPYAAELGRFARPRYSPSNWRKLNKDYKELQADYAVSTSGVPPDVLVSSIKDYWRYKEYEQRVLLGIGRREGRSKLTPKEKATIMAQVAQESDRDFPPIMEPDWKDIEKEDDAKVNIWNDAVDDILFGPRERVMSGATKIRNERAKRRTQGVTR